MKLTSRKVMAYLINSCIFIVCFVLTARFAISLLMQIADSLIYAQIINTAFFLGSNWADKLTWSKYGIKDGKQSMVDNQEIGGN